VFGARSTRPTPHHRLRRHRMRHVRHRVDGRKTAFSCVFRSLTNNTDSVPMTPPRSRQRMCAKSHSFVCVLGRGRSADSAPQTPPTPSAPCASSGRWSRDCIFVCFGAREALPGCCTNDSAAESATEVCKFPQFLVCFGARPTPPTPHHRLRRLCATFIIGPMVARIHFRLCVCVCVCGFGARPTPWSPYH